MSKLLTRIVSALLVLVALAVVLFGAKPGALMLDGKPVRGKVVVTYWEKWTAEEAEAMQRVVDRFNRTVGEAKGIFVHYLSISAVDQKTLVSTAGGDPPDIAGIWGFQMGYFASYGALRPLTELVEDGTIRPSTREMPGTYKYFIWKLVAPDGKTPYAASSTPASVALYWNKDMFRAAGLDPEKPPKTMQEITEMSAKLVRRDGRGNITQSGFLPNIPGWWDYYWGQFFGNQLWDERTDTFRIDTPEQRAAYAWYQSFARDLGQDAVMTFTSGFGQFNTPQNPFMDNKVAMCIQGPWFVNYVENNTERFHGITLNDVMKLPPEQRLPIMHRAREMFREHYGAAPIPNALNDRPGSIAIGDLDVWAIPRNARHPKEALEAIRFFSRRENMEMLATSHSKPSPLMDVSKAFIENHPNPYVQIFEDMMKDPDIKAQPTSPYWPRAQSAINAMTQKVWLGEPVGPALAELQAAVDRFAAEYKTYAEMRNRLGEHLPR